MDPRITQVNGVDYTATSDANLVKRRTYFKHRAVHDTYVANPDPQGNGYIEFKLNVGEAFVNMKNSYLTFLFGLNGINGTESAELSSGWTDLFESILLLDRHGVEIERITALYDLAHFVASMSQSNDYLNGTTRVFDAFREVSTAYPYKIVIPLHFLCAGLFDTRRLVPPQLLDGMTVRLQLRNADKAFVQLLPNWPAANERFSYSINNPELVLESCQLDNRLAEMVMQQYMSPEGINIPITSYNHLTIPLPEEKFTIDDNISLPCSRGTTVLLSTEVSIAGANQHINNTLPGYDFVFSRLDTLQVTASGVNIPNRPVSGEEEMFHLSMSAFERVGDTRMGLSVEAFDQATKAGRVAVQIGRGIGAHESGVAITNTFPLRLRSTFKPVGTVNSESATWAARTVDQRTPARVLHVHVKHERIIVATPASTRVAI